MELHLHLEHLTPRRRHLIGVSGGRDSVALLHAMVAAGHQRLVVCHFNHRLRGRASTADAAFVRKLAEKLGLPFEFGAADVKALARERKQSVETCARETRHVFFASVARKHRCPRVILAHHAEDQAETVLMRVLRGTGLHGLAGMAVRSELVVEGVTLELLRPLLAVRRAEIDAYIAAHGLCYREDESNAVPGARRNQLRLQLLPQIVEQLGMQPVPALLRLATIAAREDDLLDQLTSQLIADAALIGQDGSLSLHEALRSAHPALQHRVMKHWLTQQTVPGITQEIITEAVALMTNAERARVNLPDGLQLRRKAGRLRVARQ